VYQIKGRVRIAAVSIYQAPNTASKGITSVYSQQNAWLRKNGRTEDPRKALHTDIKETLKNLQKENVLIIIGGNFNDSNKLKGLHHVLSIELGLHNPLQAHTLEELSAWTTSTCPMISFNAFNQLTIYPSLRPIPLITDPSNYLST
jgi:hypothetical protein